jgi:DNA-binding NtrC family response regulator
MQSFMNESNGRDEFTLGDSPQVRDARRRVLQAAADQCPLLLVGEAGTGRQLLARLLHQRGPRSSAPFVPIRCETLFSASAEGQLFGHAAGTIPGTSGRSLGAVRSADGGVLFFDEVGETPLDLQSKLLHLLLHQEVTPLGETGAETVDVQMICATTHDLEAEVVAGTFCEALYRELQESVVDVPSLRDRAEDIPALVEFYADKFARKYQRTVWTPPPEIVQEFCNYDWPGNVRQLAGVIEEACVFDAAPAVPS